MDAKPSQDSTTQAASDVSGEKVTGVKMMVAIGTPIWEFQGKSIACTQWARATVPHYDSSKLIFEDGSEKELSDFSQNEVLQEVPLVKAEAKIKNAEVICPWDTDMES